jgi:hypothetical protein
MSTNSPLALTSFYPSTLLPSYIIYRGISKYVHVIPEVYGVLRTEDAPNDGIRKSKENQAVFAVVEMDP